MSVHRGPRGGAEPAEWARLRALVESGLHAARDDSFDRFARMVRAQLQVPVGLVSLVDDHRQFFPGAAGLGDPWAETRQTPLSHSFCKHVVATGLPLVVRDARLDDRVSDNPAIPDLGVVGYAGMPLTDAAGTVLGSLCAIDTEPRDWTDDELQTLADLAAACSAELRLRILAGQAESSLREAEAVRREAEAASVRLALLAETTRSLASTLDVDEALRRLAGLLVPRLADWSAAVRLDGDVVTAVAVVDRRPGNPAPAPPPSPVRLEASNNGPLARMFRGLDHVRVLSRADIEGGPGQTRWVLSRVLEGVRGDHVVVVSIRSHDQVYGALTLVRTDPDRPFLPADVTLVTELADRAALAVENAHLYGRAARASETLQRSLLTRLPEPDHIHLVARYLPAGQEAQVGGDWYDAFLQPDGATVLVIGDVVGHDMSAAAAMGQLRNLLRGTAFDRPDTPAGVLTRVDRAIRGLQVDTLATAVVARVEQTGADRAVGLRRLRWSNAGHPPPMLLHADGTVESLDRPADLLLGLDAQARRTDHEVVLEPGATLLLYTDGLVERRESPLDHGLTRLRQALAALAGEPLDQLCDNVVARLVPAAADDDVALVAARFFAQDRPRPVEAGPVLVPDLPAD